MWPDSDSFTEVVRKENLEEAQYAREHGFAVSGQNWASSEEPSLVSRMNHFVRQSLIRDARIDVRQDAILATEAVDAVERRNRQLELDYRRLLKMEAENELFGKELAVYEKVVERAAKYYAGDEDMEMPGSVTRIPSDTTLQSSPQQETAPLDQRSPLERPEPVAKLPRLTLGRLETREDVVRAVAQLQRRNKELEQALECAPAIEAENMALTELVAVVYRLLAAKRIVVSPPDRPATLPEYEKVV